MADTETFRPHLFEPEASTWTSSAGHMYQDDWYSMQGPCPEPTVRHEISTYLSGQVPVRVMHRVLEGFQVIDPAATMRGSEIKATVFWSDPDYVQKLHTWRMRMADRTTVAVMIASLFTGAPLRMDYDMDVQQYVLVDTTVAGALGFHEVDVNAGFTTGKTQPQDEPF